MTEVQQDDGLAFPWWKRGVIYQVYPRSFQDSNGDGTGDLRGITSRLDYVSWLGVSAIWISPFYPSPMADFGYDVSDYCAVDPLFGTLADFDALLTEAHARDIRVIVDFVPNHTSDQHPWFLESRASKDNPKRDWYFWRDAKPDGTLPNNWLAHFGGPMWTLDEATGQYYLHSFLPQQPDLNWRNPEVKAAMLDALRFWLDKGVDGFRFDVAHNIMKDPNLADNPPAGNTAQWHRFAGDFSTQLHINDKNHPDIHVIYKEIRKLIDSYSTPGHERFMIGETHVYDGPTWAALFGDHLDEMHMPGNFGLLKTPWNATAIRSHVEMIEQAVPEGGWPNYVISNHDDPRTATRVGAKQAKVAMMLLLTLRGTPTIYNGEELGMENVAIPADRERDPWGLRVPGLGLGRDPQRTPMQWDTSPNAGFTTPAATPWLPLADDWETRNVAVEKDDAKSILNLTEELLVLRGTHPALAHGDWEAIGGLPEECLVYTRSTAEQRLLVALNLTDTEHQFMLPYTGTGLVITSTGKDRTGKISLTFMVLQPNEGILIDITGAKLA
ncbi:MAG TPA: alpha-amylase family glycosyl hydrolase [Thermomicrobiales bacterium]|nr:alpha-amylase family glycosyl hydrolase [Thermomicrobiales bacterium]